MKDKKKKEKKKVNEMNEGISNLLINSEHKLQNVKKSEYKSMNI